MLCHRLGRSLATTCSFILLTFFALAPPAVRADCPGNALPNASFEDGFSARGTGEVEVANGWHPWWQDGPFQENGLNRRPEFKAEDAGRFGRQRVREGNFAQKWGNNFATHHAGIYQQVNVPANSTVKLTAWAQSWSSNADNTAVSEGGHYGLSVGLDPTGGTDWSSPNVVWSPRNMTMDQWVQLSVQAQAKGGTVTVYLRGDAEFRLKHNDAYFDEVCLTYSAPPPPPTSVPRATNTPAKTSTPSNTPTLTPSMTPTITPTPRSATLRVLVFDDRNGNSIRDDWEALVPGARIELTDMQRVPIASYTTDGKSEPYAFGGLKPGAYLLNEVDPPGYTSVSPNQMAATLLEDTQIDLAFADRLPPSPTPTHTPLPSATPLPPTATPTAVPPTPPTPTATPRAAPNVGQSLYNISGILLIVLAVAIGVAWRFLRPRV